MCLIRTRCLLEAFAISIDNVFIVVYLFSGVLTSENEMQECRHSGPSLHHMYHIIGIVGEYATNGNFIWMPR